MTINFDNAKQRLFQSPFLLQMRFFKAVKSNMVETQAGEVIRLPY